MSRYDDRILLGVLLNTIGLTLDEVQDIASGRVSIETDPWKIKELIFEGAEANNTLVRKILKYGLTLDEIGELFGDITSDKIEENIDNIYFFANSIDFTLKINKRLRRKIGKVLYEEHSFSLNQIANLLNVSTSTISLDKDIY